MKQYTRTVEGNIFNIEEFDSVLEFENIVAKRHFSDYWKEEGNGQEKEIAEKPSWHGVNSTEQAYGLMKDGWQEGVEQSRILLENLKQMAVKKRVQFKNDVVGFCPNVPLSIMNVPNSMVNISDNHVKRKVISIVYFNSVSWRIGTREMIEAGLNVIRAILEAENNGYRVQVKVATSYNNYISMVTIKNDNQPLNLLKMMFPIAHPAWLRVIGFNWLYKSKAPYMSGNGKPIYVHLENKDIHLEDFEKKVLGETAIFLDFKTAKNMESVRERMKEKNVKL